MKTITFDSKKASEVENAVSEVFGCRISEIVSIKDTLFKKVVVFILYTSESYSSNILSINYQICHLYVPTVVVEVEYMKKVVPGFELKILNVYEKMDKFRKAIA